MTIKLLSGRPALASTVYMDVERADGRSQMTLILEMHSPRSAGADTL